MAEQLGNPVVNRGAAHELRALVKGYQSADGLPALVDLLVLLDEHIADLVDLAADLRSLIDSGIFVDPRVVILVQVLAEHRVAAAEGLDHLGYQAAGNQHCCGGQSESEQQIEELQSVYIIHQHCLRDAGGHDPVYLRNVGVSSDSLDIIQCEEYLAGFRGFIRIIRCGDLVPQLRKTVAFFDRRSYRSSVFVRRIHKVLIRTEENYFCAARAGLLREGCHQREPDDSDKVSDKLSAAFNPVANQQDRLVIVEIHHAVGAAFRAERRIGLAVRHIRSDHRRFGRDIDLSRRIYDIRVGHVSVGTRRGVHQRLSLSFCIRIRRIAQACRVDRKTRFCTDPLRRVLVGLGDVVCDGVRRALQRRRALVILVYCQEHRHDQREQHRYNGKKDRRNCNIAVLFFFFFAH